MIHESYRSAAAFHGHLCPGLAIGVRAAWEALRLLGVEAGGRGLVCLPESRTCAVDGIQAVSGATLGNGRLEIRPRGKMAFNFYDRESGKSLRLAAAQQPAGLSREEKIEFWLTAPLERVFAVTPAAFPAPADSFSPKRSAVCARCGESCDEPFLRVRDGEIVCLACAEKQ